MVYFYLLAYSRYLDYDRFELISNSSLKQQGNIIDVIYNI